MKKQYISKAIRNPKNAFYVVKVNLDLSAGKILYGNTAGLRQNILGSLTKMKIKQHKQKLSLSDTVLHLDEFGYVKLDNLYDQNMLQKFIDSYSKLIEDDRYSTIRTEYKGKVYSRYVNMIYKQIPEIKNFLTDQLIRIIKDHYGGNFQVHHVLAWRNYHVPEELTKGKEMFASHWHCDGRDTTRITLFVNLCDVSGNTGPLHVQSINRTKELVKMGFKGRHDYSLPIEVVEDPNHVVKLIGPPGTAILCNPQLCLHRADIPAKGQIRDIIEFRFKPSNKPLDENWNNTIEEENISK